MKKRTTVFFGAQKFRKTVAAGVALSVFCTPYLSDLVRAQNLYADVISVPSSSDEAHQLFEDAKAATLEELHSLAGSQLTTAMDTLLSQADAAISQLSYNDDLSYDDNLAALNTLSSQIAVSIQLQQQIDAFESYKESIISELNSEVGPGASSAVNSILADGTSAIEALAYNTNLSYEENERAAYELGSAVHGSVQLQQDKDAFDRYKESLLGNLMSLVGPNASAEENRLLADIVSAVESYPYDENLSYQANTQAFASFMEDVQASVDLEEDITAFNAYKSQLISQLYSEVGPGASSAVNAVLADGSSAIEALAYDRTISYAMNEQAAYALASAVRGSIQLQQDKDAFDDYKELLLGNLITYVGPNASSDENRVLAEIVSAVENYAYDEMLSYQANTLAFSTFMDEARSAIDQEKDVTAFNAYKEELISQLFNVTGPSVSTSVNTILADGTAAIQALAYDRTSSLTVNEQAAYDLASSILSRINLQQDMENFEARRTDILNGLTEALGSDPSSEEQALYDTIVSAVNSYAYDPQLTYSDNITAFEDMISSLQNGQTEDPAVPDNETAFASYKEMLVSDLVLRAGTNPSSEMRAILEDGVAAVNALAYDDTKPYEENTAAADALALQVAAAITNRNNAESFEAAKTTMMDYIASCAGSEPSSEVIAILTDGQHAFDQLAYDSTISYESNIAAANDLGNQILGYLNSQLLSERFEQEKDSVMDRLASLAGDHPSEAMIGILQDAANALNELPYNTTISYESNISGLTDLVREMEGTVRTQLSAEAFEDYKATLMGEIVTVMGSDPSSSVVELFYNGSDAMEALAYDNTVSYETNISQANSLAQMIASSIMRQMDIESFDAEKSAFLDRLSAAIAPDPDESEIELYYMIADAVNSYAYDETRSYEDNLRAFASFVSAIQTSLEETSESDVDVSGFPDLTLTVYDILDGEGIEWESDSDSADDGLTFRCEGAIADFTGIAVDGNIVAVGNYSTFEGSTYCTLSSDYLQTLPDGEHRLVFIYCDGISAPVNFSTVKNTSEADQNASSPAPAASNTSSANAGNSGASNANAGVPGANEVIDSNIPSALDSVANADQTPIEPSSDSGVTTARMPSAQDSQTAPAASAVQNAAPASTDVSTGDAPASTAAASAITSSATATGNAAPNAASTAASTPAANGAASAASATPAASSSASTAAAEATPSTGESFAVTELFAVVMLSAAVAIFGYLVKKSYVRR